MVEAKAQDLVPIAVAGNCPRCPQACLMRGRQSRLVLSSMLGWSGNRLQLLDEEGRGGYEVWTNRKQLGYDHKENVGNVPESQAFFFLFFIGVHLLYNVVLVSAVQQSESVTCIYVSPPSLISLPGCLHPTPLGHHRAASWFPCTI